MQLVDILDRGGPIHITDLNAVQKAKREQGAILTINKLYKCGTVHEQTIKYKLK